MRSPLATAALRVAYGVTQLPRVAWYVGHGLALRRLSRTARERERESRRPQPHTTGPVPSRARLYAAMATLLRRDLENVEAGLYPLPADHDGSLPTMIARSRLFFADLPDVHRRREDGRHDEVLTEEMRGRRPGYIRRT